MRKSIKFLSPRVTNILITLVIVSLPLLRERVRLPEGGYEIATYRPIFLLVSYLQMKDYYPFLLMVGLTLVVYVAVSAILAVVFRVVKQKRKK